jgi:hypothetical protein
MFQEGGVKITGSGEVLEVRVGEVKGFQVTESGFNPGCGIERAVSGVAAEEQAERGASVHVLTPVRLRHCQLVQVGEQSVAEIELRQLVWTRAIKLC